MSSNPPPPPSDPGRRPPEQPPAPGSATSYPQESQHPPASRPSGYPPPGARGPSGPRAGFWKRFAAALLDGIIISIIPVVLIVIGLANSDLSTVQYGGQVRTTGHVSPLVSLAYVLWVILPLAYFVYFEGGPTGQTLGKKVLGIRVIDDRTGGPIGYGRAFLRWLGHIVSGLACYLGYLWMLWDNERQTWHDKMASDLVVPISAYPLP